MSVRVLALVVCLAALAPAQRIKYIGAIGGISTLSADGRTVITPQSTAVSLYKPENGAAVNVFGGVHLDDYFSIQGNYVWNANPVRITSTRFADGAETLYDQRRNSNQHAFLGEVLVNFRDRFSGIRPYLSIGAGVVRLSSEEEELLNVRGPAVPVARHFVSTRPAIRSAVGIDLRIAPGWALRYSFAETIRGNAFSKRMDPRGERNLANFQNLFGLVRTFGGTHR